MNKDCQLDELVQIKKPLLVLSSGLSVKARGKRRLTIGECGLENA
jgi:hypothetical protein